MTSKLSGNHLLRLLRVWGIPVAASLSCLVVADELADAATVARKVYVSFDGTISGGNTYILGSGELDVTGTFRKNGDATISNGIADIPGNVNASSGFLFDSASLGALTATNWVTEAVLVPDVPTASQPGTFNHFLDVQGDVFFRYSSFGQPKVAQYGFYDGAVDRIDNTPDLPTSEYSHVALVWNSGTRTLEGFIDGVSQGTLSTGNVFATPSTNVGYGFFARSGFLNRAIDGKLAAVAFSSFTGTFNPGFGAGFDFQLDPSGSSALALSLEVNAISGGVSIANNTSETMSIQGYDIASPLGSLDVSSTGWWSLADQGLDPVSGGEGPGETWQEGANPSSEALLEAFLLGGTTLAPGESLNLGRAYDAAIDARDLEFRYRLNGQSSVLSGNVDYDANTPQMFGDYDNDLDVDGRDFLVWQRAFGTTTVLPNDRTPGSVSQDDLAIWEMNYGISVGQTGLEVDAMSVPEPLTRTMSVLVLVLSITRLSRRNYGMRRAANRDLPIGLTRQFDSDCMKISRNKTCRV